jgi:hypothetical protein
MMSHNTCHADKVVSPLLTYRPDSDMAAVACPEKRLKPNTTKARLYCGKPPFTCMLDRHKSSAPATWQRKLKAMQLGNGTWRTEIAVNSNMQDHDNDGKHYPFSIYTVVDPCTLSSSSNIIAFSQLLPGTL